MSAAKKMVKLLGVSPTRPMRDADGDGVPNIMDCKPNNPKRQGWFHKKTPEEKEQAKVAKITARKQKEYQKRELQTAVKKARYEERKKQAVETAKYREKQSGERRRKSIKSGGMLGQFMSGFESPKSKRTTVAKPTYKFVKKGKHYKRVKVKEGPKRSPPPKDIDFGFINKKVF